MDIYILLGDNDPFLPKLITISSVVHIFPASLNTFTENEENYIKVTGKYDQASSFLSKEEISNKMTRHLNKRLCLMDSMEKYFLRDALFTHFQHKEVGKWCLTFKCDERTFRDEDFFTENPLEETASNLEELINTLDQKVEELGEITNSLENKPHGSNFEELLFISIFKDNECGIQDTVHSLCVRAKRKITVNDVLKNIEIDEISLYNHILNMVQSIAAFLPNEQLNIQKALFNRRIEFLIDQYDWSDVD